MYPLGTHVTMAAKQLVRTYYTDHFPVNAIAWLTTRLGDELVLREWAIDGGEYYKRYVTAKDAEDFRVRLKSHSGLVALHAGPVWFKRVEKPADSKGLQLEAPHPHRRELTFDIDLNDYDFMDLYEGLPNPNGQTRPLSLEKCDAAWPVAGIAIKILTRILRDQFGFGDYFCCYSGRRGVHLWVLDERAMALDNEGRSAIASFVNLQLSKCEQRASMGQLTFAKAYHLMETVHELFENELVVKMGVLDMLSAREEFLTRLGLGTHDSMHNLSEEVSRKNSGMAAWAYIKTKVYGHAKKHSKACGWFAERLDETVLAYVWPRIDLNVTKGTNHLIKSPFVAHPKTMRIAVPLRFDELMTFEPATAPTLGKKGWREALLARGGQLDGTGLADWVWHLRPVVAPPVVVTSPDPMDVDMEDLVPNGHNPSARLVQRCDVYGAPIR